MFLFPTRNPARALAAVVLSALATLAACGGGTSQQETFSAQRVLVFGDEDSTLTSDGRRYGVNGISPTTGTFSCNEQPLWVQSVAGYYGFVFAECNPQGGQVTPRAFMRANAGAKVADIAAQVEAQVAAGGFRDKDLALVLGGANDIFELYAQFPSRSEDSLMAEARQRGERMAQVVNRLVGLNARVIVSNLPDLGLTPYARAEARANQGGSVNRAELISRLTTTFNETLGIKVLLDGRYVGLVQLDLRTQAANRSPLSFGLINVSVGACADSAPAPTCTTATLRPDTSAETSLWADSRRMSSGGQTQLATMALERAIRNPF